MLRQASLKKARRPFPEDSLLRQIHQSNLSRRAANSRTRSKPSTPRFVWSAFCVPEKIRDQNPFDLPLSVRLERALKLRSVRRLGDLDGVPYTKLESLGNCSKGTITELVRLIERMASGEFKFALEASPVWSPVALVRMIDALVEDLPARHQVMVTLRLGGMIDEPLTLEAIGSKFGLTRERVRQVVDLTVERLRKAGSLRLKSYLERVESFCTENVCPLTPDLLAQWLGSKKAVGRYNLGFYVRLLAHLCPSVSVWPSGQQVMLQGTDCSPAMERAIEEALASKQNAVALSAILSGLQAKPSFRNLKAGRFLDEIYRSRSYQVSFPRPDAPVLRPA